MVDFQTIQEVYYMVAATGVIVAAIFYVLNLRETTRSHRITLTTTIMDEFSTKEAYRDWFSLMNMEWTDFDDFEKKYDSRINPDNAALRLSMWGRCEKVGQLYREGLLDLDTIETGGNVLIQYLWTKFKPIIEAYRMRQWMPYYYSDFESVAKKLIEYDRVRGDTEKDRWSRVIHEQLQKPT